MQFGGVGSSVMGAHPFEVGVNAFGSMVPVQGGNVRPSQPPPERLATAENDQADDVAEKRERETIRQLVTDARKQLADALGEKGFKINEFRKLGMNEGLFTLLKLAELDENGDGKISTRDIDKYHVDGQEIVEAYKNFMMNSGIVCALILSVVFPIAYESEIKDGANAAAVANFIFLQSAVSLSAPSVLVSAVIYNQLSFALPSLKAKLWYIGRIQAHMAVFEFFKNAVLVAMGLALIVNVVDKNDHPLRWFAFVQLGMVALAVLYCFTYQNNKINAYLFTYTKELLNVQKQQ